MRENFTERNSVYRVLENTKHMIDWESASASARDWWKELVQVNEDKVDLIVELAEQLRRRRASLDDFFLACCYSKREGVRENLTFLDQILQDKRKAQSMLQVETVANDTGAKRKFRKRARVRSVSIH